MKKQPAEKSYFFDKGYRDIVRVIKKTWSNAFKPVSNEAARIKNLNVIIGIFTVLCDIVVFPLITIVILSVNLIISALLFLAFFFVGIFVYLGYSAVYFTDLIFCLFKHISSQCPNCQKKFGLPTYKCPKCGALHTCLRPSKYGILKRKCICGERLPTTFFNGRQKLQAVCPFCRTNIKDGGRHIEIMIPVVGGNSSGKTCFINMAISQISNVAAQNNLVYSYSPAIGDEYVRNKRVMDSGRLPTKTFDSRLKYYQFYLTPKGKKIRNLISLCDVAGETYEDNGEMGNQLGYKYANAFLMLVDPLSITKFRNELSGKIDLRKYGASERGVDVILNVLINTLENMHCLTSKNMIKTDVAVVFTKCDIPSLESKIGASAVKKYMQEHNISSKYEAQNKLCEAFLSEYEEDNFLNGLKSKFRSVQFFACSALGHVANGTKFSPTGVEDPVLWLIDKASKSIDLKEKWA